MKHHDLIIIPILVFVLAMTQLAAADSMTVYFTPDDDALQAIVQALDDAKNDVRIEAPAITHPKLQQAIFRAVSRAVNVTLILDPSTRQADVYTDGADFFADEDQIATHIFKQGRIANHLVIVDSAIVLSGTVSFVSNDDTETAAHLIRIQNQPAVVDQFLTVFAQHLEDSYELPSRRMRALMGGEKIPNAPSPPASEQTESAKPARAAEPEGFVGNINSLVLHKTSCTYAKRLKDENKESGDNREEFIRVGYKPCGHCEP